MKKVTDFKTETYRQIQVLEGYLRSFNNPRVSFKTLLNQGLYGLNLPDSLLAKRVGVSKQTVSKWRKGKAVPHPKAMMTALQFLILTAKDDLAAIRGGRNV